MKQTCFSLNYLVRTKNVLLDKQDLDIYGFYPAQIVDPGYVIIYYGSPVKRHYLHKLILPGDYLVDHKDRNKLNNTRDNLRVSSFTLNMMNSELSILNTSGYKGVTWDKRIKRWRASITYNKRLLYLGSYVNIIDAAKAYNKAAIKYFGELAWINPV